jgi:DNA-binding transcriptional regulator YiaG
MPDIASVLKAEISRLARKEARAITASLSKAVLSYRSEIAELKRRAARLEQELGLLQRSKGAAAPEPQPAEELASSQFRFTADGLASQRRRLGLSADNIGLLVGASGQSVYNWESGKVQPKAKHMQALAALRGLGKNDAAAVLASRRPTR